MANPYGMTEFSVAPLLANYQGAQANRAQLMMMERQIKREDVAAQREAKMLSVYSRIQQPTKGGDPASAAAAPAAPPTGATASPPRSWLETNKGLIDELMTVSPKDAFEMLSQFQGMDKADISAAKERNDMIAVAAQHLLGIPAEQRGAELARIAPSLKQRGVSDEMLASADLTDRGLEWMVAQGRDVEKLIADQTDKWVPVGEGGILRLDRRGNPVGNGNPALGRPMSKADYDALPPGATYVAPDGQERVKGGAGRSGPSTFQ